MKLVIDIPEKKYKHIISQKLPCQQLPYGLSDIIKNGTLLPKGHGRLIDAGAFGKELHRYTEAPYQYALKVFNDAPTIIEADISGKEMKE